MRNITFRADARLIDTARELARAEGTTLNEQFRHWLEGHVRQRRLQRHEDAIKELRGKLVVGRKLTRDEVNER